MNADDLRQVAREIRKKAEPLAPGAPWADAWGSVHAADGFRLADGMGMLMSAHTAAWHPGAALAVAAWLDIAGADLRAHGLHCADGCMECDDDPLAPHIRRALAFAAAWRGERP